MFQKERGAQNCVMLGGQPWWIHYHQLKRHKIIHAFSWNTLQQVEKILFQNIVASNKLCGNGEVWPNAIHILGSDRRECCTTSFARTLATLFE